MPDPFAALDATPRHALPLLHVAQVQKEFLVNEALARVDVLMHCLVEGQIPTPPAAPSDGQAWIVAPDPVGAWAGMAGSIAARVAGNWLYVAPHDGLRAFDRSTSQELFYLGTWRRAQRPSAPTGGNTVDVEARSAIVNLLNALTVAGVLPST